MMPGISLLARLDDAVQMTKEMVKNSACTPTAYPATDMRSR
ncbi:hypothetical protein [Aeromonas molluscorum]|jgi:hypothetical protein|nr:hypothetical protein [Aeromonas molluscorum]